MNEPNPPITSLDAIAGGGFLAVLKALVPFLPPSMQKAFAVALKCMELKNLLLLFGHSRAGLWTPDASPSATDILSAVRAYLPPNQQSSLDDYFTLLETIQLFEQMPGEFNPEDLFSSMFAAAPPKEEGGERNDHV